MVMKVHITTEQKNKRECNAPFIVMHHHTICVFFSRDISILPPKQSNPTAEWKWYYKCKMQSHLIGI